MNEEIVNRYRRGESTSKLAKDFGVSPYIIRKKLIEFGVEIEKRRGFKTNSNLDTSFFEKIDDQNKAYVLGLMYSDGSVCPYLSKSGKICSYKIRIRLQESDYEILRKISLIMCGRDLIKIQIRKEANWQNMASFQIGNIKLGQDLIKLGCPPKKSSSIKLPSFDLVPENLYNHFLRGFFDGDGGITSKSPIVVSFTSNETMCKQIQKFLLVKNIRFKEFYERKNGYGSIVMSGKDNCYNFYKYLYADSTIYLKRKKEKFEELFLSFPCERKIFVSEKRSEYLERTRREKIISAPSRYLAI